MIKKEPAKNLSKGGKGKEMIKTGEEHTENCAKSQRT